MTIYLDGLSGSGENNRVVVRCKSRKPGGDANHGFPVPERIDPERMVFDRAGLRHSTAQCGQSIREIPA